MKKPALIAPAVDRVSSKSECGTRGGSVGVTAGHCKTLSPLAGRGKGEGSMRGSRISETRRARTMRRNQTAAESQLWRALRGRGLKRFKFVRQEPVGPYFADFACREQRLIVEIDGATHSADVELRHDLRRAGFLHAQGYRVVRVTNEDVYRNLDGVLETILAKLTASPHPS